MTNIDGQQEEDSLFMTCRHEVGAHVSLSLVVVSLPSLSCISGPGTSGVGKHCFEVGEGFFEERERETAKVEDKKRRRRKEKETESFEERPVSLLQALFVLTLFLDFTLISR